MKPVSRRKCTANMRAVNEENGLIFVSAASVSALLASHTYSGTMKASLFEKWFEDKLLNCLPKGHVIIMDNAAFHKKEVLYQIAKKILAGTDFPTTRIHRNTSH